MMLAVDLLTESFQQLFAGGPMFECVQEDDRRGKKHRPYEQLAYGGRYDRCFYSTIKRI